MSKSFDKERKKKLASTMNAPLAKIDRGELLIETFGLYQNDEKWHFRLVVVEAPVPVLSEEVSEE